MLACQLTSGLALCLDGNLVKTCLCPHKLINSVELICPWKSRIYLPSEVRICSSVLHCLGRQTAKTCPIVWGPGQRTEICMVMKCLHCGGSLRRIKLKELSSDCTQCVGVVPHNRINHRCDINSHWSAQNNTWPRASNTSGAGGRGQMNAAFLARYERALAPSHAKVQLYKPAGHRPTSKYRHTFYRCFHGVQNQHETS